MDNALIGQRVELHPVLDDWMRGDRYGAIVAVGRVYYTVLLDKSQRRRRYLPDDLRRA
jgi:hypothetical protein